MPKSDPEKLDEEARKLAESLGIAMGQWGNVENELYLLYTALCEVRVIPNPSTIVYESMVHLETKLNAIDRLVEFRFKGQDAQLEAWSKLDNKIRRKVKNVRNKLAHWRIWRNPEKGTAFLGPPLHVPLNQVPDFGTSHGGAMFSKDLMEHATLIGKLAVDIREFTRTHIDPALPERPA